MKKLIRIIKSRRALVLASAFAPMCFGALLIGVAPSRLQDVQRHVKAAYPNEVRILNKLTTVDATFEITPTNHLLIRVKNLSSKNMNGYLVEVNGTRISNELSVGDRAVFPGQTDELEVPIRTSSTTVTILAALFTDGSIEAEPVLKTELSEWRLGLKKELVRGLAELDEILASPDVYSPKGLDRLGSRFSPQSKSDSGPSPLSSGHRDAKDSLNSALQSIRDRGQRNGNAMQKQRLLDLRARIERRISSL